MLRTVCKSKIHRATVTEANVQYAGSITVDTDLMKRPIWRRMSRSTSWM